MISEDSKFTLLSYNRILIKDNIILQRINVDSSICIEAFDYDFNYYGALINRKKLFNINLNTIHSGIINDELKEWISWILSEDAIDFDNRLNELKIFS